MELQAETGEVTHRWPPGKHAYTAAAASPGAPRPILRTLSSHWQMMIKLLMLHRIWVPRDHAEQRFHL